MKRLKYLFLGLALLLNACATASTKTQEDYSISQSDRGVVIQSRDSILFDTGKADIKPTATPFLDQVATLLKTKSSASVLIEGHTDSTGSPKLHQPLSELRALRVMKELVDRGVDKSRIKAEGFGMVRPIADNGTDAGRQMNRRTEIILLGEKKENLGENPFGNFMNSVKKIFQ